jgi:very-short-patch-repair endonuclease
VDGVGHDDPDQMTHDARRDHWLEKNGFRVLRITAKDVLNDETLEAVLARIAQAAAPSTASRSPSPAPLCSAVEEPDS